MSDGTETLQSVAIIIAKLEHRSSKAVVYIETILLESLKDLVRDRGRLLLLWIEVSGLKRSSSSYPRSSAEKEEKRQHC
jgi:hypothetical protein